MSIKKELSKILDDYLKNKKICHFTMRTEEGELKANVTVEAGFKSEDIYKELNDKFNEKISEDKNTTFHLSVNDNTGDVPIDNVKKSLENLKFGKKGFKERQWPKNETYKKRKKN